jgi:hypothetical protein
LATNKSLFFGGVSTDISDHAGPISSTKRKAYEVLLRPALPVPALACNVPTTLTVPALNVEIASQIPEVLKNTLATGLSVVELF